MLNLWQTDEFLTDVQHIAESNWLCRLRLQEMFKIRRKGKREYK
jgi:hypothetical protein